MSDPAERHVVVPVERLQYIRDLLTEKVYGSSARSPGHNARLVVDDLLSAAPPVQMEAVAPFGYWIEDGVENGFQIGPQPRGDAAILEQHGIKVTPLYASPQEGSSLEGNGVTAADDASSLATSSRSEVPDGWQLVPINPTDEMLRAAIDARFMSDDFDEKVDERVGYLAMLQAAPSRIQPAAAAEPPCGAGVSSNQSAAPPVQMEAVAWRWRWLRRPYDTEWRVDPGYPGTLKPEDIEVQPLYASPVPSSSERDDSEWTPLKYATQLATILAEKHFPHLTTWRPLDDLMGVLSQIDNMTTALVHKDRVSAERDDIIEMCARTAADIAWSAPTATGEWALREAAKVIASSIRSLKSQPAQESGEGK